MSESQQCDRQTGSRTIVEWAEPRPATASALIAGLSLLLALPGAAWKPLGYDELFTFHVAHLPWRVMLDALKLGVDQQPFPYFAAHRATFFLFGDSALSARLPELLGFVLLCACIYLIVSRRTTPAAALLATAFCWASEAMLYSRDARPYALMTGFTALAVLSWQRLGDAPWRRSWCALLMFSLAAAVSSHYYAVLAVFPLALGELVRSRVRGAWALTTWVAFTGAAVPLLLSYSIISHVMAQLSPSFWAKPQIGFVLGFYPWLLAPAGLPAAAIILLSGIAVLSRSVSALSRHSSAERSTEVSRQPAPLAEYVAALGLACLPFLGWMMAAVKTSAITERYVLEAVIGLAVLVGFGCGLALQPAALAGIALAALATTGFERVLETRALLRSRTASDVPDLSRYPDLPVVVQDAHRFVSLAHAAPRLASRLIYIADPDEQGRYAAFSSVDQGLLLLPRFIPQLRVQGLLPFLDGHRRFLLLWSPTWSGWLLQKLVHDGARIEVASSSGSGGADMLLLVSSK